MDMFARTLVKSCCIHPLTPAGAACSSVDLPLKSRRKRRAKHHKWHHQPLGEGYQRRWIPTSLRLCLHLYEFSSS